MSREEIIAIVGEAGLSLPTAFRHETPDALGRFYNGVGAGWFPVRLRKVVTGILERLEPLAFVHDVEFATAPPNYFAFSLAQVRWAYNALLLAIHYQHHRFRFLLTAWLAACCCQLGGYRGFREGKQNDLG